MSAPAVPSVEDVTAEWLSDALGSSVEAVTTELVGTGQMGSCHRLRLTGDPALPATVLAKLPSAEAGTRELMANAYANEIRFYRDLAPSVDIRVPGCYYAGLGQAGTFTLLLEDMAPSEPGDQIAGCTPGQALAAVVNLAGLHGPRWCDPALWQIEGMLLPTEEIGELTALSLVPAAETFIETLGDLVSEVDAATLREAAPLSGTWMCGRSERFGLLHMDYRLDNLLFTADGTGVCAVDWQGMAVGLPGRDVAFFLSTGLSIADRRDHEHAIVAAYRERLSRYVGGYSLEDCWDDYRYGLLQTVFITVFGLVYGSRTERGDRMFAAMTERGCAAIRDLGTLDLIRKDAP